jgi:hypothetical protein
MSPIERFLVGLDSGWRGAALRIALGLATLPAFRSLLGENAPVWILLALFFVLLAGLRVVPGLLRRVLRFSAEAKSIWAERRNTARKHDSYQWQKLFWIGLGLLPYAVIGRGLSNGELVLTSFCLIGGAAGLLIWHSTCTGPTKADATKSGL